MIRNGWVYGGGVKRTIKTGRKTVHGKWGDKEVPSYDWVIYDTIELERDDDPKLCGMCEYKHIKYLHFMVHAGFTEFDGEEVKGIVAGRYCAPCMLSTGEAADIKRKEADVLKIERRIAAKAARARKKQQAAEPRV